MHTQIVKLYNRYNYTLRPLVSEIEGRIEHFEEPLLINVASMFDSIALSDGVNADTEMSLDQASCYLDLSISLSYQYLIKNLDEKVNAFEKRCSSSDRNILDNGNFIGKYRQLKDQAYNHTRIGRKKDDINAINDYALAYKAYSDIEKLIDKELPVQIMQHTRKSSIFWTIFGWSISIFISVVIGKIMNIYGETIIEWIKTWINV